MKVGFLVHELRGGGAERQLVLLADGLSKRGHEVEIWVYRTGGEYERLLGESSTCRVVQLPGRSDSLVLRLLAIRRILRATNYDVFHPYLNEPSVLSTLAGTKRSGALLVWGVRQSRMNLSEYPLKSILAALAAKVLAGRADLLIFNSTAGSRSFPRRHRRRSVVVHNGIDTSRFRPATSPDEYMELRRRYGLPLTTPIVLFVGRDDPTKGLENLAESIRLLGGRTHDFHLVVVGLAVDHPIAARLAGLPVSFLGRMSSPEEVYRVASVLYSSSRFGEGFSNTLAEALASGCRLVATEVGDAGVILSEHGRLVAPGDTRAATDAIIAALEAPLSVEQKWERHEYVSERFGVERLVDTTEKALLDALAVRHSRHRVDRLRMNQSWRKALQRDRYDRYS